jgi:uncharacterized membrane protein
MKSVINIKRLSQREIILLFGGLTSIAFLILLFRIRIEGNLRYTFLVWNLFLAYVPVGATLIYQKLKKSRVAKAGMLGFWLLFFPNAPYILTDYVHLRHHYTMLDFILVSVYAFLGLAAGFYSYYRLQKDAAILQKKWSTPLLLFLTSIGVYLGRFIRWNSWDIIDQPFKIVGDVLTIFIHPVQNWFALEFIAAFTVILVLTYALFKRVLNSLHAEV